MYMSLNLKETLSCRQILVIPAITMQDNERGNTPKCTLTGQDDSVVTFNNFEMASA